MSRSEDFDSEFWSDPDVAALSWPARYVYIWSWTNSRCNMSGAYQVRRELIAAETGVADGQLDGVFAELEEHRFAYYDGRVLWVRSRVKRLRQKTPNIAKSIAAHLQKLPTGHPYVALFLAEYGSASWLQETLAQVSTDSHSTVGHPSGAHSVSGLTADPPLTVGDSPRDGLGDGELLVSENARPPQPPKGGRRRDVSLFEEQVKAYAADRFGLTSEEGWRNVKGAISDGATSDEAVEAWLSKWRPDLLGVPA